MTRQRGRDKGRRLASEGQGSLGDALLRAATNNPEHRLAGQVTGTGRQGGSTSSSERTNTIHGESRISNGIESNRGRSGSERRRRDKRNAPRQQAAPPFPIAPNATATKTRSGVWIIREPVIQETSEPATKMPGQSLPAPSRLKREPDPLRFHERTFRGNCFDDALEQYQFAGIQPHWSHHPDRPDGDIDLVVGLDFGTTFSKVVIYEPGSRRSWAVPLTTHRQNPYLLHSEVFCDRGSYSLQSGGERLSSLKMPFLSNSATPDDTIHATAFLALVLDYAKQWMQNEQRGFLAGREPFWFVHVGLPTRDFENHELTEHYLGLVWSALALAAGAPNAITTRTVREVRERALVAVHNRLKTLPCSIAGPSIHREQVSVYPEIMAQLYGYLRSRRWDEHNPEFMLVDVGGGTVDSSVFNVVRDNDSGDLRFCIFNSRVLLRGTMALHHERLGWIQAQLGHTETGRAIARELSERPPRVADHWLVPDAITAYLEQADFGAFTLDDIHLTALRKTFCEEQLRYVLDRILPRFHLKKRAFPLILVGGGSFNSVYRRLLETHSIAKGVGIEPLELSVPDNLATRLAPDIYQRISVAYGLAFENLGTVLTPDRIEGLEIRMEKDPSVAYREAFITKDMV